MRKHYFLMLPFLIACFSLQGHAQEYDKMDESIVFHKVSDNLQTTIDSDLSVKPICDLDLFNSFNTLLTSYLDTIISPHDYYEHTFETPSGNWKMISGGWLIAPAPFGNNINNGHPPEFNYNTYWPEYSTLYLRKEIDLSNYDLTSINWFLGVDNGFELFVNGNLVASHWAHGYTYRWEYSGIVNPTFLNAGVNIVAIVCTDGGGLTAFDMMMTGNQYITEGDISNIVIIPRVDGSSLFDVHFNLNGSFSQYNITIQASFNGGSTYTPVPPAFLSGDTGPIAPGNNKHIVWDGLGSFPNIYSTSAKLKIIANPN